MGFLYGIRRLRGGTYQVRLPRYEHQLLQSLPEQLRPILAGEADVADVRARLYPPAYEALDNELEYRELVGSSLEDERVKALDTFAATLSRGTKNAAGWTTELDEEELQAWLSALHDGALVLGAVLGITEDGDFVYDAADPNSVGLDVMNGLQVDVLRALATSLPEG